jgi:hypothetical protein
MRNYGLLMVVACLSTTLGAADCKTCDCSHWPWKDVCDSCCTLKLISNSSSKELAYFLNLDNSTAKPLSDLKAKGTTASTDDLRKTLGDAVFEKLTERIEALTPLQRQYLLAPAAQKLEMQKAIEEASEKHLPPDKPNVSAK